MDAFDAEFYLRRHLEDEFGLDDQEHLAPERARALVVLGLLSLEQARGIVQVYRRAARARRHGGGYVEEDEQPDDAGVGGARVVLLDQAVQAPFGTVHLRYATISAQGTRLAAKIDFGKGGRQGGFRHGLMELDVVDDQGTSAHLHFGGGGGNRVWRGHFGASDVLSPSAQWLEVCGERVELAEQPSSASVRVHDVLAETGPDLGARAARYLRYCLQREEHRHRYGVGGSPLSAVLDTLVASGSLAADSTAVAETRAVQDARQTGEVTDPSALPEPWRTVLASSPRKGRGPKGDVPVSVVTPVFDGVRLTVFLLSSRRAQFSVELQGVGSGSDRLVNTDREMSPVTFTAVDDRGNHYLGSTEEFHSSGSEFGGTVGYQPALDPSATAVDLHFDTPRARAVVQVPLRWAKRP